MNQSAVEAVGTINGYEAHYRPVWAASFRKVKNKGVTAYFTSALAAEVAAWRFLYSIERRVMNRDGEIIFAAKSAIDGMTPAKKAKFAAADRKLFLGGGKVVEVERRAEA
ncbi:hypothetical protein GAO09_19440 [Rhizobiales bacterium RZME27]|uniref:Uncharacterized protein n=1 Tax=Endobacterium cereale TaxID=2663029 RepID=A0A6A8AHE7_9HYPH|nr:hypothetical protein [Endobacterium cereale]MQY48211.1 hypothetical protein [Endobacterium cereale]